MDFEGGLSGNRPLGAVIKGRAQIACRDTAQRSKAHANTPDDACPVVGGHCERTPHQAITE